MKREEEDEQVQLWLRSNQLTFSLDAPVGHLPTLERVCFAHGRDAVLSVLVLGSWVSLFARGDL